MMYMIPLVCGWDYFPERRGLVTGVVVGAYGIGSAIFNQIARAIVNPGNVLPTIKSKDPDLKFFTPDIANHVPMMFRILVIIWAV